MCLIFPTTPIFVRSDFVSFSFFLRYELVQACESNGSLDRFCSQLESDDHQYVHDSSESQNSEIEMETVVVFRRGSGSSGTGSRQ